MKQHCMKLAGVGCLLVLIVLLAIPLRNSVIRLGIVASTVLLFAIVIRGCWRVRNLGKILLAVCIAFAIWIGTTLRLTPVDSPAFVAALRTYEGTRYVWGGETRRGIDCSGLIRMALRDAYLSQGRIGAAARVWYCDSAARDFSRNYGTILSPSGSADRISRIEHSELPPGTIAVTEDGLHTLAYLGDGSWIQASPDDGEVVVKPSTASDRWYDKPVVLFACRL